VMLSGLGFHRFKSGRRRKVAAILPGEFSR
jgi:hypothetical protein